MKRLIFILLILLPNLSFGQFYNPYYPYNSYEQQQQAKRVAEEWGRNMWRQMEKQHQEYASNDVLMGEYVESMALGHYEQAYKKIEHLAENRNKGNAWLYTGIMNEVGLGTSQSYSYAEFCYTNGTNAGDENCKRALHRIQNDNYLNTDSKNAFILYFKKIYNIGTYLGSQSTLEWNLDTSGSSSRSNSGTYSSCRVCGGSGVCTSCQGHGGEWRSSGYYTGSGSKSWISCSSCNGSKKCFNCHGTGRQ